MAKSRKVRSATINDAENGYEVQHDLEPDADDAKGGGMVMGYEPPKKHVFGHHEHGKMMNHVASLFPPRAGIKQQAMDDRKPGEQYADTLARKAAEGRKKKS